MSQNTDTGDSLYRKDPKVYPRDVKGKFARLRNLAVFVLLGLYYLSNPLGHAGWLLNDKKNDSAPAKAKITLTYKNYVVNKGIPDSRFQNNKPDAAK